MKKSMALMVMAAVLGMGGCTGPASLTHSAKLSTVPACYQDETEQNVAIPQGYAELRVVSSLKTHLPGEFGLDDNGHGLPHYQLAVSIGEQTTLLQGELLQEKGSYGFFRNAESGEGMRYRFGKRLRVKAGTHKLVVGLPGDDINIEKEISLAEKSRNTLVLEPVYRLTARAQRIGFYGESSFNEGIKGFKLVLNGEAL
ncbi:hypothetical protein [Geomesophilobacter sediminis]|uniref:Lipoprotein n=1 Tax=Geomesophilobacter sediminis TaxID=2798584 RepID=A0A8J7JGU0_9BACT|nr:hypothetical protein [Geomesophilobacter sediminis]MBJ6723720.1 hypothetical protein [Geomesophilobacter sediminis]